MLLIVNRTSPRNLTVADLDMPRRNRVRIYFIFVMSPGATAPRRLQRNRFGMTAVIVSGALICEHRDINDPTFGNDRLKMADIPRPGVAGSKVEGARPIMQRTSDSGR